MPTITTCAAGRCAARAAGGPAASTAGPSASAAHSAAQAAARHDHRDAFLTRSTVSADGGQPAQMFWLAVRACSLTGVPPEPAGRVAPAAGVAGWLRALSAEPPLSPAGTLACCACRAPNSELLAGTSSRNEAKI